MLKVAIKYCGGCNPDFDRVAVADEIQASLSGRVEFVSIEAEDIDLVLAIEGCQTACVDLDPFLSRKTYIVKEPGDAQKFVQSLKRNDTPLHREQEA